MFHQLAVLDAKDVDCVELVSLARGGDAEPVTLVRPGVGSVDPHLAAFGHNLLQLKLEIRRCIEPGLSRPIRHARPSTSIYASLQKPQRATSGQHGRSSSLRPILQVLRTLHPRLSRYPPMMSSNVW